MLHEFELSVPKSNGETKSVTVRIVVEDGDITSITADSEGNQLVGQLVLKRVAPLPDGQPAGEEGGPEFGGDQCVVCNPRCHVVSGAACD